MPTRRRRPQQPGPAATPAGTPPAATGPTAEFKGQYSTLPVPVPMMLAEYEQIERGLAGRIVAMAERQEGHRQGLELRLVTGDGRRAWAGIVCAFIICMSTIAAAVILGLARHDPGGTFLSGVLGTGGLAGVAGTFIYGTRVRRQERAERARILSGQR